MMLSTVGRTVHLARTAVVNYLIKKPLAVSFEITHCCNANCQHCHRGGSFKEKRASPEKFGILSRDLSPVVAQISGGEPLLRRDVLEIVRSVRRPHGGPYLVFVTNGALLTIEKYHRLIEAGIDAFSVSLDFPDERHDTFRGIPGLFARLRELIEKVNTDGDNRINFNTVVQSGNLESLIDIAELCRAWRVPVNFSPYTWLRTQDKGLMLRGAQIGRFEDISRRLGEMRRADGIVRTPPHFLADMARFFRDESIPNCRAGERFLVVNPDGTLSPCGLIITAFQTQAAMREGFVKTNTCTACHTCIRSNSESPINHLVRGAMADLFGGGPLTRGVEPR